MAEYTRTVEQLTRDATSTPQLAQPSASLGADIVNLANTGLQFYAKMTARDELKELETQQAQQRNEVAKATLGYRKLQRELSMQGVKGTQFWKQTEGYLSQFSPEMQVQIIRESKNLTGKTTGDFLEQMSEEEKARVAAQQKAKADREKLELDAMELQPFIPYNVDLSAPDEEVRQAILFGTSVKAQREKQKADASLMATRLGNRRSIQDFAKDEYFMDFSLGSGMAIARESRNLIQNVNFNDTGSIEQLIQVANEGKQNFINAAVQGAKDAGLAITPNEATERLAPTLQVFDNVVSFLRRDDIAKFSKNQIEAIVNGMILGMTQSENPKARKAGKLIMFSSVYENSSWAQGEIAKLQLDSLIEGAAKEGAIFGGDFSQEKQQNIRNGIVKDVFLNAEEDTPQETKEVFTSGLLKDLTHPERLENLINKGVLTSHLQGIAEGNPDYIIDPERKDDVFVALIERSNDFLRRAIPKMMNMDVIEGVNRDREVGSRAGAGSLRAPVNTQSAESKLTLNEDLTVSFNGTFARGEDRRVIQDYNNWVKTAFKAFDKLGITEEEKNYMKQSIARDFLNVNIEGSEVNR